MDRRFLQEEGLQVYSGSELLVKGAYEARVALLTGYPGSPVAEFFNAAQATNQLAREKGILIQIANNEALSAARLVGSQMADIRAVTCMKSVGMHVASDALFMGNISKSAGSGGALVIVGDDPWSESTQVPADSRFLSQHLFMPVMVPSTPQEIKDWINIGLNLSARAGLYITYLVETQQADGGGVVQVFKNHYPDINTIQRTEIDTSKIPLQDRIILPPNTGRKEVEFKAKFDELHRTIREIKLDIILNDQKGKAPFGFITSGLGYLYLEHVLEELGLAGKFPILKLGIIYPIDPEKIIEFSGKCENIVVIEEKRAFVETQVKNILDEKCEVEGKSGRAHVYGRKFPEGLSGLPETAGLNPSIVMEALIPLIRLIDGKMKSAEITRMDEELSLIQATQAYDIKIPDRTPTFCPGCPHRDSSSVLLKVKEEFRDPKYMKKEHHTKPVDLVFHGDTGCYSMLFLEPNKDLMHNYAGMGMGGGTGAGIDSFITNKQVVFMGDSTFFHSGMIAISDSLKHCQDITYIILENKTTAMTGHQAVPSTDEDIMGRPTFIQEIDTILRGMSRGQIRIVRINPAYRETYRKVLEDTILLDGVKVIIADKECGITYQRRLRREVKKILHEQKFLKRETKINITPEVCEYCLECTKNTGCPGLNIEDTDFGPKIITDLTTCVADTACTKVKACPSFEEVIIKRKKPSREKLSWLSHSTMTPKPAEYKDFGEFWYAYVAGVGGMGAGTVSVVLARAGMMQGYYVTFSDRKGLAIRNGGVYSSVIFSKKSRVVSPMIPYGKADVILGLDMLEAVRGLDPKVHQSVGSHGRTHTLVNTARTPTIRMLMGMDSFRTEELENILKTYTSPVGYFGANLAEIAERFLGNKIYVNMLLLGIAYQLGELPLELSHLKWAIQISVPQNETEENLRAFEIGRKVAVHPGRFLKEYRELTAEDAVSDKKIILKKRWLFGGKLAADYENLVFSTLRGMNLEEPAKKHFALRVYELIQYENINYARRYARRVREIYEKDEEQFGYKATEAVIQYAFKVMAVKDEIYVSHLLTSEEKRKRDFERYGIDPKNGDRLIYRHITRPEIPVGRWTLRFDIKTRDWMLNVMKHMKFLRHLLPGWHKREKAFIRWYEGLVDMFSFKSEEDYWIYTACLSVPEEVRGYREIRYPKMEEAKKKVEDLFSGKIKPEYNGNKLHRPVKMAA